MAQLITQRREEKEWTVEELAEKAGVNLSTLKETESGETDIHMDELQRLAWALGCPIFSRPGEQLGLWEDDPKPKNFP